MIAVAHPLAFWAGAAAFVVGLGALVWKVAGREALTMFIVTLLVCTAVAAALGAFATWALCGAVFRNC